MENHCPNCGSGNIDYYDVYQDAELIIYYFKCLDCGTYAEEHFDIVYNKTVENKEMMSQSTL